jgi:G6PDH family F420-dependent oxidoreductase
MIRYGFTLSSEEHPPATLVRNARHAEEVGFDFCSISDHFHPWTQAQGHSPFVWSVLGAIAHATDRIAVGTGVTCPIVRSHPTAIAQASATTSLLFEGRFFLGVGTGEALNEHIAGHRWPRPEMRVAMLDEAVAIIRRLWTGDTVDHHGTFYDVDNARLFDPPARAPEIIVSGFGEQSVDLAARIGDGYWGHDPAADKVQRYRERGGTGPCYAQISVCCGPDVDACRATVHRVWPNGGIPGQLAQDLPTWTHFEQAAQLVSVEAATEHVPCGPDLDAILASVDAYRAAGYDHLYFHQIGPDQDAFFQAWESELQKALTER